jgi:hypothetical protein
VAVQIKAAILRQEEHAEHIRKFTEDELSGLLQSIPTVDERKTLSAYHGDITHLGDVEQFMLEMMSIPQVLKGILKWLKHLHVHCASDNLYLRY